MTLLLEHGYGFDPLSRDITLAMDVEGHEVEWTLGFVLANVHAKADWWQRIKNKTKAIKPKRRKGKKEKKEKKKEKEEKEKKEKNEKKEKEEKEQKGETGEVRPAVTKRGIKRTLEETKSALKSLISLPTKGLRIGLRGLRGLKGGVLKAYSQVVTSLSGTVSAVRLAVKALGKGAMERLASLILRLQSWRSGVA